LPHHPIRLAERIISTPGTPDSDQQAPEDAPAPPAGASRAILRRRRIGILLAVAAFAYLLDLGSKMLVVAKLEGHDPIRVIGDLLEFQVIRNSGAAFSMGQAMTIVFTAIAAAVIVVICRLARKLYSLPWAIALGLLLGGAFGNLTDRVFRWPSVFRGEVVDFISVKHFAVFNLADSAIVCGGILVVLLSFLGTNPDGSTHREAGKPGDQPGQSDGPSAQSKDSGGAASAEAAG
jgi:signal peptidase II